MLFFSGVDRCKICDQFLNVDVTNVSCCENQFHKKCLDEWLTSKNVACPNCDKNLITVCKGCNQDLIMDITVAECCKTQLHQECLDKWLTNSIRCRLCEGDLISGKYLITLHKFSVFFRKINTQKC
ncbi:uncharacterized protein LOC126897418 isoform X2 [Daktulosphaira vitifoliae]|uniref:uncharacterized protein LOC126897418 isoform X2 n=1 Tax=Daktulosphaira vitifoliae TaxID=58002 RepID=UPI0021AA0F39|nr:uncharacterized protein LOC126897418 isoform X2 [Daktulosphaira vitifoliae]